MKWILNAFEGTGYTAFLLARAVRFWFRKLRPDMTAKIMYDSGLKSLPVVGIVAFFSGMILCLQTGIGVARYGEEEILGGIVAQFFAREFGPFMTCIILVGTVVSAYAAEIGTMTVSEETDALRVMSIDPVGYLAAPRILSLSVMALLLTLIADLVGMLGGSVVASSQLDVPFGIFWERALDNLQGGEWFGLPRDLYAGLLKAALMGFVIAGIGCAQGLQARGGALGVGRCVRRAVISSIVMILVISYNFTWLTYRAFGDA